jgi:hypothetical protein
MSEHHIHSALCRNCRQELRGHYCSNCGQPSNTPEIDASFIFTQVRKAFISFNSGYFYTIKMLFLKPGPMLQGYIEGKRIKHTNPFSFVVLTAGIYSFLFSRFNIVTFTTSAGTINAQLMNSWYISHIAAVQLFLIPVFAVISRIVFTGQRYTIAEFLIINTYLAGQRIVLNILLLPILIYVNGTNSMSMITNGTALLSMGFFVWTTMGLFPDQRKLKISVFALLTYLILLVILGLILMVVYSNQNLSSWIFG